MKSFQQSGCAFCERVVPRLSADLWDTPVAETDQHLIVPTKGALVPGWLLVVSKQHALCSGELGPSQFLDLAQAIGLAKEIVERHFGPATIFEHGPAHSGTALGCGIDHLHFHVAPLKFSLLKAVDLILPGTEWHDIVALSDVRFLHLQSIGYAVIGVPGGQIKWFPPPTGLRQPLRKAIASYLGTPERFDYAEHPHTANVLQTLEQVAVGV